MGIAFLLLGLVPLVFLPTLIDAPEDDEPDPATDVGSQDGTDLLDEPVADGGEEQEILTPVDENDQAREDPQPVDPNTVLSPVIEDDEPTASGGNEDDVLLPVDGIDGDYETIYLDVAADKGLAYSEIDNFEPGTDVLHVSISPEMVEGPLDVEVTKSEDGQDSMVYVEQQLIAVLKGASDASRHDVDVVIEQLQS